MYGHSCYSYGTWRSNKVGRGRCESNIGGASPKGGQIFLGGVDSSRRHVSFKMERQSET